MLSWNLRPALERLLAEERRDAERAVSQCSWGDELVLHSTGEDPSSAGVEQIQRQDGNRTSEGE